MRRILLLSLLVIALPVVSPLVSAKAGTGSAAACSNGGGEWGTQEYPIITTPITLALQTNYLQPDGMNGTEPTLRLCYSSSPAGYSGQDTVGGSIDLFRPEGPWYDRAGDNIACVPQSNPSALAPSCYVDWEEETYPPPYSTNTSPRRYSVSISFCAPTCITNSQGIGWTGIIIEEGEINQLTTYPWGEAPAGTSGVGITTVSITACVNGTCQPLPRQHVAGAGVTTGEGEFPVCWVLTCVPTGTNIGTDRPIVAVQVGSTVIPVTSPTRVCVSPYDVVVGQPYYCS